MFKDGITVEVTRKIDYKMMCDRNSLSEVDYETYSNEYMNISDIPLECSKEKQVTSITCNNKQPSLVSFKEM